MDVFAAAGLGGRAGSEVGEPPDALGSHLCFAGQFHHLQGSAAMVLDSPVQQLSTCKHKIRAEGGVTPNANEGGSSHTCWFS